MMRRNQLQSRSTDTFIPAAIFGTFQQQFAEVRIEKMRSEPGRHPP
jgi:hypothetical protein